MEPRASFSGDYRVEVPVQLTLTDQDARLLRELLQDYRPALQFESARTEAKEMRHQLVLREELIDRLLSALTAGGGTQ